MKKTTIVVIGGGFGGVYTVKHLLRQFSRDDSVQVILVSEENYFIFTPMLHEVATGGLNRRSIIEPIRDVIKSENFFFSKDRIKCIDIKKKTVRGNDVCITFDYVVVASGSKTSYFGIPGAKENTLVLKTIDDANRIKNHIIERFEEALKDRAIAPELLTFVIVGGGPTGVELAGEICEFVSQILSSSYHQLSEFEPKVVLLNSNDSLLKHATPKLQKIAYRQLTRQGVTCILNAKVTKVQKNAVVVNKKQKIKAHTIIWTTGVTPNSIKTVPNILDKRGHLPVNEYLRHQQYPYVFALGDCALQIDPVSKHPVPNLAQAAVGQAEVVAHNLCSVISQKSQPKAYSFKEKGFLISLGHHYGAAQIRGLHFKGFFAWWMWRTIYLSKLLSFKNKLRTALDWSIDLFYDRDISEIK